MSTELQYLLDKIQEDGVNKANEKAEQIVKDAEKKAVDIIATAEKKKAALIEEATKEAEAMKVRSEQAIKQAARDVLLSVEQSVRETFERLLKKDLNAALDGEFLKKMTLSLVETYTSDGNIEVKVAPEQVKGLSDYVATRFAEQAKGGIIVSPDKDVTSGIRVMLDNGRVEQDFTGEAVLEKMSEFLRPALVEIIRSK